MVILPITGCLSISADELFSLPEVSAEYLKLQAQINEILNQGAEFAPPTGGPNRQAVQLVDLNGTGSSEVVAFFAVPGDSSLLVYIFELIDGDYVIAEIIDDGVGTDFESVRYVDMDGDGVKELIIGWQMGPALRYMSIYSIVDFHKQEIVKGVEYTEISIFDMTGNGNEDVVIFRMPTPEAGAVAEVYSLMQDGEIVQQEARLSTGIESISRILQGNLIGGSPALFVDSDGSFENGSLVTDILAFHSDIFTNISLYPETNVSEDTVRQEWQRMASADIKGNGIIKVPTARLLKTQSETEYFAIDWYAFRSSGYPSRELTTYHNIFDEWFLILPDDWREKVSIRREDSVPGERTIVFSYFDEVDGWHEDFLKIFKLSGDNARQRAVEGDREMLMTEGTAVYAFELIAPPDSFDLTFNAAMVRDSFRLIYTDWITGSAS